MKVIGSGNTGAKLALMFDDNALLFSTAHQDSNNYIGKNIITISDKGASKRFTTGIRIWEENYEKLKESLTHIVNEDVIIFSSGGGGSGSSSLRPMSEILIENNNRILIVLILPYKKEVNPPLANSVQTINSLMPILSDVSVILFNNDTLVKDYENDWNAINSFIIKRVDYIVNLLSKYNTDGYSPLTLDQSELESVVFGGGFLDISETFLEDSLPKFNYCRLDKTTKNCLSVMFVNDDVKSKDKMHEYQNIFTGVLMKLGGRASNSRIIPGILRAEINYSNAEDEKINDRAYVTIASGLNIDRYLRKIEKVRDLAMKKAEVFSEKIKGNKIIKGKQNKVLDI